MKIRTDFVTNSSSSSFVMAFKLQHNQDDKYSKLMHQVVDIIMQTSNYGETDIANVCTSVKEFKEYLAKSYVYSKQTLESALQEDKWLKKVYDKGMHYLNEGYSVAFKEVDYHDSATTEMIICASECSDDFIIIEGHY